MAVFFDMKYDNGQLLLATGNNAELFSIDTDTEQKAVAYSDEKASQITAMTISKCKVYLGTANPARINQRFKPLGSLPVFQVDPG